MFRCLVCFVPLALFSMAPVCSQQADTDSVHQAEIRLAEEEPGDDLREARIAGSEDTIYLHSQPVLTSEDIATTDLVLDDRGKPAISITFTPDGVKKMTEVTTQSTGKRLAVVVDNRVITAPKIVATITKRAQVSGSFTLEEARRIADALNAGSESEATPASPAIPQWVDLFNGQDLTGWVNVNTDPDTWLVKDGLLVCRGRPIGVMRSEKQYENFILHIEWRHMEPGGNSGVFVWSEGFVPEGRRLPKGMEVQMLELEWINLHPKPDGEPNEIGYISGELFGAGGLNATPDNPRGRRSMSRELRCKGAGEWNAYDVVCVDGTVKLAINGKFVNSIRDSDMRKGYLCLESEGAEIHFRNIRILELPPGITTPEQTAKVVE